MNKRKAALANLILNSSQGLLVAIAGLVMIKIYRHYMSKDTIGAWLSVAGLTGALGMTEAGIAAITTQRLSNLWAKEDKKGFAQIAGTACTITFLLGLLVCLLGFVLSGVIANHVKAPPDQIARLTFAAQLNSVYAGGMLFQYTLGAIPQALQRTIVPGIVQLGAFVLNVVVMLIALPRGAGVYSMALGNVVLAAATVIGLAAYMAYCWRKLALPRLEFTKDAFYDIFHQAKSFILAKIAGALGTNFEGVIIANLLSAGKVADYNWSTRLCYVTSIIEQRVGSAALAGLAHVSSSDDATRKKAVWAELIHIMGVFSGLGMAIALAFTHPLVNVLAGPDVFVGVEILFVVVLSWALTNRKQNLGNFLQAEGEFRLSANALIAEALIRLVLSIILVKTLGLIGIPLATAITAFVMCQVFTYRIAKHLKVGQSFVWAQGALTAVICAAVGYVWPFLVHPAHAWIPLIAQGLIFTVLIFVFSRLIDKEWAATLTRNLKRKKRAPTV